MKDLGFEEVFNKDKAFHLKASLLLLGTDILIIISGMKDHIGSVTLAQPYYASLNPNIQAKKLTNNNSERISSSISTLTQYHHRDDHLLAELARQLSQQLNKVVTVIGGIHVDNISKEEINILSLMIESLKEQIIRKVNNTVEK